EELDRLGRDVGGHILVTPQGLRPASHPSNPRDAADDRLIVPAGELLFQLSGGLLARGPVVNPLGVTHPDGIARIEADDLPLLDVNAGDTVPCGGNQIVVVEAYLTRPRCDLPIPIDLTGAEPQVPLANDPGRV